MPEPRKRRTVFMTAGLSASAAVIAASLSGAQSASADQDQGDDHVSSHHPDREEQV